MRKWLTHHRRGAGLSDLHQALQQCTVEGDGRSHFTFAIGRALVPDKNEHSPFLGAVVGYKGGIRTNVPA